MTLFSSINTNGHIYSVSNTVTANFVQTIKFFLCLLNLLNTLFWLIHSSAFIRYIIHRRQNFISSTKMVTVKRWFKSVAGLVQNLESPGYMDAFVIFILHCWKGLIWLIYKDHFSSHHFSHEVFFLFLQIIYLMKSGKWISQIVVLTTSENEKVELSKQNSQYTFYIFIWFLFLIHLPFDWQHFCFKNSHPYKYWPSFLA